MAMLTFDGREYDTEQLSDAAKAQVTNIQLVDQKLSQLQQEQAIMQTARNAYAQGAGRFGSRLHGVASFLGLNTPSLWLRGSNATLFQSFNTGRDIPF